jgi:hypothetical protein
MKITITRALNEVKLLDKRINSAIENLVLADVSYAKEPGKVSSRNQYMPKDDFIKKVKGDFQSVNDLIQRRSYIKAQIAQSNSLTEVNVAGVTMAVAEAIEKKASIEYDRAEWEKIEHELYTDTNTKDRHDKAIETNVNRLIETTFGRDKKTDSEEVKN